MLLLQNISSPQDIKRLSFDELNSLSAEIRGEIIGAVSKNGGHLSSNLGVVELTVAIHKIFDSPVDQIVWDVGHQSYAHKLLTGRLGRFSTIRKSHGLSGYPKPSESEHDAFVAGHSSTSISVALGLLSGKTLAKENGFVIAVIGDGAMTGGMIYEAFNNIKKYDRRLIVILNDNEMSISKSNGAFARYLSMIRSNSSYFKLKDIVDATLNRIPYLGKKLHNAILSSKTMVKNAIYPSTFFEDFGLAYLGPVDGHNIKSLCEVLARAKHIEKPVIIHVETKKGRGYPHAEENPGEYHGVSGFDTETGQTPPATESYSTVFGKQLAELALADDKICAVTAAMKYGTGLQFFKEAAGPKRFFDVGIAEQHAAAFAAGLAQKGFKPVFAVYSSFLQRAYDQIIHDAAIMNLPVLFAVDRAGIVGEDGETHQGIYDVSYLSSVPNMTVYSPATYDELRFYIKKALVEAAGPTAIRYPRGGEPQADFSAFSDDSGPKDWAFSKKSKNIIVTYGRISANALAAAEKLASEGQDVGVCKLNKIHPIDTVLVKELLECEALLVVEEAVKSGSVSQQLSAELLAHGYKGAFGAVTIPDMFLRHGATAELIEEVGLGAENISGVMRGLLVEKKA